MAKSKITQVPVDGNGNWLSYAGGVAYTKPDGSRGYGLFWSDEVTFEAVMKIDGMYTGYSAKGLQVRDIDTDKVYNMFVSDFIKAAPRYVITNGVFPKMEWTVSKRGNNYGIKPVV